MDHENFSNGFNPLIVVFFPIRRITEDEWRPEQPELMREKRSSRQPGISISIPRDWVYRHSRIMLSKTIFREYS
jgi:hypothetical protein